MGARLAAGVLLSLLGHLALAGLAVLAPVVPLLFPQPRLAPQSSIEVEVVSLPPAEAGPAAGAGREDPHAAPSQAAAGSAPRSARSLELAALVLSKLVGAAGRERAVLGVLRDPGPGVPVGVTQAGDVHRDVEAQAPSPGALAVAAPREVAAGASTEAAAAGAATEAAAGPGRLAALRTGEGDGPGKGPAAVGAGQGGAGVAGGSHAAVVAALRARAALCYPRAAQRRALEGVATVRFCVDAAGGPSGVRLIGSSGSSALDAAAVDCVVRGAAPLPLPPAAEPCMSVPVLFRLR